MTTINTNLLALSLEPLTANIGGDVNVTTSANALTLATYPTYFGTAQPTSLIEDIYTLSPGTLIELFELDATVITDDNGDAGSLFRFHAGTNELNTNIEWQGNTYTAFPIEADGFQVTTGGQLPKPKIKVANIDGAIGALNRSYSDLIGAKLSRKRTLVKYLDTTNFSAGNPLADASQFFPDDIFYVNRKISENRVFIEYELASVIDVEGVKLPRRQIIQNVCAWRYRSDECSYVGSNYWDINGNVVFTLAQDVCGKKISSCKLRFGEDSVLPFGGFPGAGLF